LLLCCQQRANFAFQSLVAGTGVMQKGVALSGRTLQR
jgi:hypothetical protein